MPDSASSFPGAAPPQLGPSRCSAQQGDEDGVSHSQVRQTPLHIAAAMGRTATVEMLLKRGANVDVEDDLRQTPLHLAASNAQIASLTIETLLRYGANKDAKDDLTSTQWRTLLDAVGDAEKPHLQALLDGAIKREQKSEKERKEALPRRQVALLETVPSLTEEQCGEQLQSILTAFVQIRNLEDHTTQIAEVFAKLQTLQDDLTETTFKYHELTKEVADLRQAQVANPLPLPPGTEAAIETTSAPLTVSASTSSSSVMATSSGPAAGADSTVAVTSNEAGTSATAAAPRPEPVAAGPSHAGPYVDRKAVQIPWGHRVLEDIESWIGSMRAYFEILGTQAETQAHHGYECRASHTGLPRSPSNAGWVSKGCIGQMAKGYPGCLPRRTPYLRIPRSTCCC
ncbi:hypothetical protein CBR_g23694 [Chara braunii]|uniref:Uncharacterized protein n=1 Tax=Chara braunii TaxID=69332 RepID=A0A388L543_CHABU|nr:hypothetical protein CBR_g23694 [Chara braunii]|eukprot:GBG77362.1 hypothetical protein CBR_g23694 [Chara braunii]